MIQNPWIAGLVSVSILIFWIGLLLLLKKYYFSSSSNSRKVVHIGTGLIFMLCWHFFPEKISSKYIAAAIPMSIVVIIVLSGSGILKNLIIEALMSRSGSSRELLNGPLYYGISFLVLTIFLWKTIYSIIPLTILCAGDGIADVIGGRIKTALVPWSKTKTMGGSLAMFGFGSVVSLIMVWLMFGSNDDRFFQLVLIFNIILINLISAVVESFSPSTVDNITVPGSALLASVLFFPIG